MVIAGSITRRLGWLLVIGVVLMVLTGCKQRDETNPFIGPTGGERYQPFG
jgi:hypothetical protein